MFSFETSHTFIFEQINIKKRIILIIYEQTNIES